jgi:hypothetical protein
VCCAVQNESSLAEDKPLLFILLHGDQRGERFLGIALNMFSQQNQVIIGHSAHIFTPVRKSATLFSFLH